jgi:hypothetical protein
LLAIAGQYDKGLMTCRAGAKFDDPWSAPIMMQSSGGSVGFQDMAMLSSMGQSELFGSARGNDRCSLYCDHAPAAGQCVQASVGFALNSVKTSAIIV